MNEAIGSLASRFAENRTVRTINAALIDLIPLVLIGTICIAITNIPFYPLQETLNNLTAGHWSLVSHIITFATYDIIGLAALFSISYALSEASRFVQRREISTFIPLFTAFGCYVILLAWDPATYELALSQTSPTVLLQSPGRTGVFAALFVAFTATNLFIAFGKLCQRLFGGGRRTIDSTFQIRTALWSVFPIVCTLLSFVVLRLFADWVMSETMLEKNLEGFLQHLITGGDFFSMLATIICMQILWFIGAHGTDTMLSFLPQVDLVSQSMAGLNASTVIPLVESAQTVSHTLNSRDFYHCFVSLGGTGATLSLLVAMFIFGSAAKGKKLAKISVFPVAFNINETLLYGIPIVLNPFMLVPFLLAPLLTACLSYTAFATGLVPPIIASVEWTTPILLSGYLETGSLAGSLLQFMGLVVSFLVYAPFVRITRRVTQQRQLENYDCFKHVASQAANNEQMYLLNRRDTVGEIARELVSEFNTYFDAGNIPFYMVYQPKCDKEGRVVGSEALLRWSHPTYGMVPPDILVELTDEAQLSTPLGRWITRQALEEYARWPKQKVEELILSINLNPRHILEDTDFPAYIQSLITTLQLDPQLIEMEITEHVAVRSDKAMREMFARIRATGVGLSIDDMGVGYSSLTYISDFGAGTVKLDLSLVDRIASNIQQQEIVRSVVELASQLHLVIIVEGVETKEQLDALVNLGCRYFQGYYFSKPLKPADFIHFARTQGTTTL
ncbi:MAG: EAL domain-containing protein [Coriobacteriales bacterium]|nr:EAL domain-containing protein [Coriobacteriales bacterium]